MFTNLRVDPEKRCINNLPEGLTTLFLARISELSSFLFLAIVGPEACSHSECELGDSTRVIFFTAENFRDYIVFHGQKYIQGGGTVSVDIDGKKTISWTGIDECGRNEIFENRISPEDILVAL